MLGEWLGIDLLMRTAIHAVEDAVRSSGPAQWAIGGVALAVVGILVSRLLGGGRW